MQDNTDPLSSKTVTPADNKQDAVPANKPDPLASPVAGAAGGVSDKLQSTSSGAIDNLPDVSSLGKKEDKSDLVEPVTNTLDNPNADIYKPDVKDTSAVVTPKTTAETPEISKPKDANKPTDSGPTPMSANMEQLDEMSKMSGSAAEATAKKSGDTVSEPQVKPEEPVAGDDRA